MSNEEDDARVHKDQDDARQYRCFKKYEEIVKQVYVWSNACGCGLDFKHIVMLHDAH